MGLPATAGPVPSLELGRQRQLVRGVYLPMLVFGSNTINRANVARRDPLRTPPSQLRKECIEECVGRLTLFPRCATQLQ